MRKSLIVFGAALLIAFSILVSFYVSDEDDGTPPVLFTMGQGPGTDLVKPLSVSCTPAAGYDFCYTNTYGAATATIHSTEWQGEYGYGYVESPNQLYYIDEVYINIKYSGDILYKSTSTSWISCGSSGCSATSIPAGKVVIATAPASSIGPIQFTAWDKFTSTSGEWWYSCVQFGWLTPTNYYVINCYDNNDCDSGTYCDKSGAWDTWSCKVDTCDTMPAPPNICDGFDLWSQKCLYGEYIKDQLLETNSVECGCVIEETINTCRGYDLWSQSQWKPCVENIYVHQLIESNSVECGCVIQDTPNVCIGFDLWSQKQATPCVTGLVQDELIEVMSGGCGYLCSDGETKGFECIDNTFIVTQHCSNNEWIDTELEACPFNWINLKSILEGYIDDIKEWMDDLL